MNDLFLLAINLTRRCNLGCAHCYMDAETLEHGGSDELTTTEVKKLLDEIVSRSNETMVVLTGGEPLLRRDLEQLVEHGSELGLSMVVGTNGLMLTEQRVTTLKAAGVMGMGISLDSLDPHTHDTFRGAPGSWEKTLNGMEACRQQGLPFQVHFSVTEANADEVPAMIDFTRSVGAKVLNIFFLVCTGRGESISDISPEHYEQVLEQIVAGQAKHPELIIRARCAPHFKRIAYQQDPASPLTRAEGYEGGGCIAGIHYCRITPEGAVTACPYLPDEEGSLREQPFWSIWDQSQTFNALRKPKLEGKCGHCEYQKLCGGCRARPVGITRAASAETAPLPALADHLMETDPWCVYQPEGGAVIEPLVENVSDEVSWSSEAQQRLKRVPGFLRKMVKKRAESYVREQGEHEVTAEHMAELAKRRHQGGGMPDLAAMKASVTDSPKKKTGVAFAWTAEAQGYLDTLPPFLQSGIATVAEDVAREEGRLEVNMKLLSRLEEENNFKRALKWDVDAEARLEALLNEKVQLKLFIEATLEQAIEREAKIRNNREQSGHSAHVTLTDVESIATTYTAGVAWQPEALARVEAAPEFVRGGIKKAAEFNARREGIELISSSDLTRFRNRAMMRAVQRMKGMGLDELSFDAYDVARGEIKRLQDNDQAAKRFATIRDYVETRKGPYGEGLGLMDSELLEKMKAELAANKKGANNNG